MSRFDKICGTTILVGLMLVSFGYMGKAIKAQELKQKEVEPYAFAHPDANTVVYKGVYQACEYYVATSYAYTGSGSTKSVSIALGRGCK